MRERPILMRDDLVLASLAGTKTQTRRPINPQPTQSEYEPELLYYQERTKKREVSGNGVVIPKGTLRFCTSSITSFAEKCPHGIPGDRLWVREAFDTIMAQAPREHTLLGYDYRAGHHEGSHQWRMMDVNGWRRWTPSIHMPRKACRLVLDIVSVRVQRLQDISEADCIAEGCPGGHGAIPGYPYHATPFEHFRWVWVQCYGDQSWGANPLVWALEYRPA